MLPKSDRKHLEDRIKTLKYRYSEVVVKKEDKQKPEIEEALVSFLVSEITPYKEVMKELLERGFISARKGYVSDDEYKGFTISTSALSSQLDMKLPHLDFSALSFDDFDKTIVDKIDRIEENHKMDIDVRFHNIDNLIKEIEKEYGTVNYMLTQFPELSSFFSSRDKQWKPNPNYKVKPRSSFKNSECLVQFFGNCALEGITI
jgi:hypothetical protein